MEEFEKTVNEAMLRTLYESDPIARVMLDHFAGRRNFRSETTVEQLMAALSREGVSISRPKAVELLKFLAEAGCGDFLVGRGSKQTRIEWGISLVEVGQIVSGRSAGEVSGTTHLDGRNDQSIDHQFALRPNFATNLTLPSDLTAREAKRLADFVLTLPFEESTL